ncbi:hypothetical protein ACQP1G_26405 [Nocardia sp. CA-107356]
MMDVQAEIELLRVRLDEARQEAHSARQSAMQSDAGVRDGASP